MQALPNSPLLAEEHRAHKLAPTWVSLKWHRSIQRRVGSRASTPAADPPTMLIPVKLLSLMRMSVLESSLGRMRRAVPSFSPVQVHPSNRSWLLMSRLPYLFTKTTLPCGLWAVGGSGCMVEVGRTVPEG